MNIRRAIKRFNESGKRPITGSDKIFLIGLLITLAVGPFCFRVLAYHLIPDEPREFGSVLWHCLAVPGWGLIGWLHFRKSDFQKAWALGSLSMLSLAFIAFCLADLWDLSGALWWMCLGAGLGIAAAGRNILKSILRRRGFSPPWFRHLWNDNTSADHIDRT